MASEKLEIVLKAARKVDELRAERTRLTTEIDHRIGLAEAELAGLIGARGGIDVPTQLGAAIAGAAAGYVAKEEMSHQDRIVGLLRERPRASVSDLSEFLYGEVTEQAKHRVRSLLWTLRKRGRIQESPVGYQVLK